MGLNGLINVKIKALAELIRSFLETAVIKSFKRNIFHAALFRWFVLQSQDIPYPGKHQYLTPDLFELIREVKNEGLLNVEKMKSGQWYKVLVENKITMEVGDDGKRKLKPCRTELNKRD